jgi:hypothetical protein
MSLFNKNTNLFVPYELKDIAKDNKCFFCKDEKIWKISDNNINYDYIMNLFSIRYLRNIYKNKDIYKLNNAKWDKNEKEWITYNSNEKLSEYFECLNYKFIKDTTSI